LESAVLLRRVVTLGAILAVALLFVTLLGGASGGEAAISRRALLPYVPKDASPTPTQTPSPTPSPTPDPACPSTGQRFDLIPTDGRYSGASPDQSPDLNLTVRGWVTVNEARNLVDYNGGTDSAAPQLFSMFANDRTPTFSSTHRVYDWDWTNNRRGQALTMWPVTLLGMATTPGEAVRLPRRSGSDIYQGTYYALVVYAEKTRISLHYARNDYIAPGYGLHVENVCVDPSLLSLYQQSNAGGRFQLPALRNNQVFGTARGTEVLAAIRDTGTFMDPRSRKDWWQGRAATEAGSGGSITLVRDATPTPTPIP
jgi:hypothetical protein